MTAQTVVGFVVAAVIVALVIWFRVRGKNRPIRSNGFGILLPVIIVPVMFGFSIQSLMHIPGQPFHIPAFWEILCAALLGIGLGSIMLYHTGYEKREDGLIYSKPNKNFKYVIIAVVAIRIALSQYFKTLDYTEFTVLTMVMAFVYIFIWRIGSFLKFRRVSAG
ncbi:CcdC protein domain-containing protein [Paenibacillus hamazuiensis]|uniref:CcdC protein domain-containing protein n=1 Tax=Paenibacillus hamazuiensis TaxID=2936508 RepID=UPI00201036F5|nr:CcdC protein domain-containing protein [Paenibacillus hamazuiensis]